MVWKVFPPVCCRLTDWQAVTECQRPAFYLDRHDLRGDDSWSTTHHHDQQMTMILLQRGRYMWVSAGIQVRNSSLLVFIWKSQGKSPPHLHQERHLAEQAVCTIYNRGERLPVGEDFSEQCGSWRSGFIIVPVQVITLSDKAWLDLLHQPVNRFLSLWLSIDNFRFGSRTAEVL